MIRDIHSENVKEIEKNKRSKRELKKKEEAKFIFARFSPVIRGKWIDVTVVAHLWIKDKRSRLGVTEVDLAMVVILGIQRVKNQRKRRGSTRRGLRKYKFSFSLANAGE